MMVRMMEPQPNGIPIEIYCFTAITAWVEYERIQGDIFDHLLAILPELGLRLFQEPSGSDLGNLAGGMREAALHEFRREQVAAGEAPLALRGDGAAPVR